MKNNRESNGKSSKPKEDYLKTAKDLKKMNELTLAIEVCDKGLDKNPNDSNIYILKSQILIDKFKEEKDPDNLKLALLNLEKAMKLDPLSYIARILASQICLKGKAYKKAKPLLAGILKSLPDDEKALSMMAFIVKKEGKKAKASVAPPEPVNKKPPAKVLELTKAAKDDVVKVSEHEAATKDDVIKVSGPEAATKDDVIIKNSDKATGESEDGSGEAMFDTHPEDDHWVIDDKLVIDSDGDDENSIHLEILGNKLTMFGRLDGLKAIFLVDSNGQLFKAVNKSGLDENVIPSLVFNLYKASVMGVRKVGYGSFQRGALTTPIGTIILINVFYATLTLVIDDDANLGAVDSRIQRYLSEVTQ